MRGDGDRPTESELARKARDAREALGEHQLDRAAYPWQWVVQDRFGRPRPIGFGVVVEGGKVRCVAVGPEYWTADPVTFQQITFASRGVEQRAIDLQKQLDDAERKRQQREP